MKLILKDKSKIEITSMTDSYNARGIETEDKRSIQFSIMDPTDDITVDSLVVMTTAKNTSNAQIEVNGVTETISPFVVTSISDNIADDSHCLSIRGIYVNKD